MKKCVQITLFLLCTGLAVYSAPHPLPAIQEKVVPFRGIVNDIQYSPFGSYFAVAARDSAITMYSSNLRTLWTYNGSHHYAKGTTVLAFSHDEKYLLFPRYRSSQDIALLDLTTFTIADILRGHSDDIRALAVSGNSEYMVSASSADNLILWKWNGATYIKQTESTSIHSRIGRITFHPRENIFACAHMDDTITVWSVEKGELERTDHLQPEQHYGNTGYLYGMEFSPDGEFLVNGLRKEITAWKKTDTGWKIHQVISDIEQGYIQSLSFSPGGKSFACGFGAGVVVVFRNENGYFQEFDILNARQDYVEDIAIHPDGTALVAGSSNNGALAFWNTSYLSPDGRIMIRNALGGNVTRAQKQILVPETVSRIVSAIDPFLFEPKDEFETEEEFRLRKKELKATVMKLIQIEIEKNYSITRYDNSDFLSTISVHLQNLGAYDLDNELYPLTVLATPGYIRIPRNEARSLKRAAGNAIVTVSVKPAPDGISFLYSDFTLVHPENGTLYPVLLEENPFHPPVFSEEDVRNFTEIKAGPNLLVQGIEIDPVFPVLYRYYSTTPIGKVLLYNTGSVPIEGLHVIVSIDRYMDSHGIKGAEIIPQDIPAGERFEIELYAMFNDTVLTITEGDTVSALITIKYSAGGKRFESTIIRTVHLRDRNAITWEEDKRIAAFMTTKDPAVLKFTKDAAVLTAGIPPIAALDPNMETAIKIFDSLKSVPIKYVIDPSSPYAERSANSEAVDFIQFPGQTLHFKAGDCDDLSILYNTLLEAVGVPTAFITVPGHIFTAFQLKFSPKEAARVIPENRSYIVKNNDVWIPVETTLIGEGFLNAWAVGLQQWNDHDESNSAELFTTAEAWKTFKPVNFQIKQEIPFPNKSRIVQDISSELNQYIRQSVRKFELALLEEYGKDTQEPRYLNKLGLLYSRFGLYDKALAFFEKTITNAEYLPGMMNAGNLCFFQGKLEKAVQYYLLATKHAPENPYVFVALSRVFFKTGENRKAQEAFGRAKQIKPDLPVNLFELDENGGARAAKASDYSDILLSDEWE